MTRRILLLPAVLLAAALPVCASSATVPIETAWGRYQGPDPNMALQNDDLPAVLAQPPIIVAVQFLAAAAKPPRILTSIAGLPVCDGQREDHFDAEALASTLLAANLIDDLDLWRREAAHTVQRMKEIPEYKGEPWTGLDPIPMKFVLEPLVRNSEGGLVGPHVIVEPHIRVFVDAEVSPCASNADGAFGTRNRITPRFAITVSPSLGLGLTPTVRADDGILGQGLALITENALVDGLFPYQIADGPGFDGSATGASKLLDTLAGNKTSDKHPKASSKRSAALRALFSGKQDAPRAALKVKVLNDGAELSGATPEAIAAFARRIKYKQGNLAAGDIVVLPALEDKLETRATAGEVISKYAPNDLYLENPSGLVRALARTIYDSKKSMVPSIATSMDSALAFPRDPAVFVKDEAEKSEFLLAAWAAEIDCLTTGVTTPFLKRYYKDLKPAFMEIIEAEYRAKQAERLASANMALMGAMAGSAQSSGDVSAATSLYLQALQSGDRWSESRANAKGVVANVAIAQKSYSLKWAGKQQDVLGANTVELRSKFRSIYKDVYQGESDCKLKSPGSTWYCGMTAD